MKSFEEVARLGHSEFRKALLRLPQIEFNPEWSGNYLSTLVTCKLFVKPVWFVDERSGCVLVIPVPGLGNMVVSEMCPGQPTTYPLFVECAEGLPLIGGRWEITIDDVRSKWNKTKTVTSTRLDRQYLLDLITTAENQVGLTLE